MSLLRDLPPDLLSEVLLYADRSTLLSLTRTNRNLASEISSKQEFTWRSLVARDWGVAESATEAEQTEQPLSSPQPQSSPQPSGSPQPIGSEEDPAESREAGGVERQSGESWRDVYRRHASHFGPAVRCYAKVAPVWRRLLAWIDAHQEELPRIKETIAPTFDSSSSSSAAFAAASAAASGASPPPSPSPSYAELSALLAQKQVEWRMFQLHMRRQLKRELEDEGGQAEEKRGSKRDRSAAASAAAAAAGGAGSGASSGASSASLSPSHDGPAQSDASDSAAPMDFETAIGLPKIEAAPSAAEQKQLEEGAPPLTEIGVDQELMCALLLHNGQTEVTRQDQVATGLFGGFRFYSFISQYRLLDLSSMLELALAQAQHTMQQQARLAKKARAQNKRRKSETDAGRGGAAAGAGAGTGAGAGSSSQAAAAPADQPTSVELLLPFTYSPVGSNADFFIRGSTGAVVRRYHDGSLHPVAPSFLSFFSRYVSDLESGCFAFDRAHGINRFPLRSDTGSDTVTRGIRIQVSVLFVPEQSDRAANLGYFFAYHIRISHDGSTATRARLVSRHWIIEHANGHVDTVNGPGVVGLTPDIYPGCPLFTYESCSPIPTRTGKMRGSFRFKCENTDEEFDVIVSTFHFDVDRNYC